MNNKLTGIAVEEQFTIFGASGAVTFSALSGLVLHVLLPVRRATPAGTAPIDVTVGSNR
jgi:hypothetical protein